MGSELMPIERVVEQADKMVASGRFTAEEAQRLKAARDTGGAQRVLWDIRARHARERLDVAVAEGAMTREEAEDILRRVQGGEHSRRLRSHLAQFGPGRRPKGADTPPPPETGSGEDQPA